MEVTRTTSVITTAAAQHLTNIGVQLAQKRSLNLSIAIVDDAGNLVSFTRMDNAAIVTIDVAIGKAKTAAYLKAPSKLFEDFVNAGQTSIVATPNITPLQGGIPILHNNQIIGAVGVSGSNGETDNEMAETIANSIK